MQCHAARKPLVRKMQKQTTAQESSMQIALQFASCQIKNHAPVVSQQCHSRAAVNAYTEATYQQALPMCLLRQHARLCVICDIQSHVFDYAKLQHFCPEPVYSICVECSSFELKKYERHPAACTVRLYHSSCLALAQST